MYFVDMNSGRTVSLQQARRDWLQFRTENQLAHAQDFKTELHDILTATLYKQNDIRIPLLTRSELARITARLNQHTN